MSNYWLLITRSHQFRALRYVLNADYQDYGGNATATAAAASGNAFPQIFWDAFMQRTGSGLGGVLMLIIVVVGVYLCAHATHTYIAR